MVKTVGLGGLIEEAELRVQRIRATHKVGLRKFRKDNRKKFKRTHKSRTWDA